MGLAYNSGQPPGTSSGQRSRNIAPSDTLDLLEGQPGGPVFCRGFYVGSTGNVKIKDYGGDDSIYYNVPAGSFIPCVAGRIYATGTTAELITIAF